MPHGVQAVRATPRWPAEGDRFGAGWEGLATATPLLDLLLDDPRAHPELVEPALDRTMLDAASWPGGAASSLLALLVVESGPAGGQLVLRRVAGPDRDVLPAAQLELSLGVDVAAVVADALCDLVDARAAVACPLLAGRDDDTPCGWLVALCGEGPADAGGPWPERMRATLEAIAWVVALAVRRGWGAWSTGPTWPDLTSLERAACRDARAATTVGERAAAPAPPEAPATRAVDDDVQFTVYRPRRIPPDVWCPVLAFAHLAERRPDAPADTPDPIEEVRRQARQALGDLVDAYADVTQDSGEAIPREGELTFVLDLPGLAVNPPQRSFRWLEDVHREEFRIRAPAALDGRTVRGALRVHLGALLVGEVRLAIQVDATAARPAPGDTDTERARPYRRIFPSYSHRDEEIVRQVEAYARTMGDEYLRDVTHLRAGETWNDRLLDFIRTADVFQLFWSRNSMRSPWVRQEWEYALSLGRPHFVRPTYWETPLPEAPDQDLPPAALRALHFQRLPVRDDSPPPPASEAATESVRAPTAPSPPPRRRRVPRRLPTALAALLFVGFVGGSLMWQLTRSGLPPPVPPTASRPSPPADTAPLQAISPDGMVLASMDDAGRIRIASHTGGEPVVIATKFRPPDVAAMRFSPDGSRIICDLRDGTTVEWDARTGARIATLERRGPPRGRG